MYIRPTQKKIHGHNNSIEVKVPKFDIPFFFALFCLLIYNLLPFFLSTMRNPKTSEYIEDMDEEDDVPYDEEEEVEENDDDVDEEEDEDDDPVNVIYIYIN